MMPYAFFGNSVVADSFHHPVTDIFRGLPQAGDYNYLKITYDTGLAYQAVPCSPYRGMALTLLIFPLPVQSLRLSEHVQQFGCLFRWPPARLYPPDDVGFGGYLVAVFDLGDLAADPAQPPSELITREPGGPAQTA
jgi:hypothetical protein